MVYLYIRYLIRLQKRLIRVRQVHPGPSGSAMVRMACRLKRHKNEKKDKDLRMEKRLIIIRENKYGD